MKERTNSHLHCASLGAQLQELLVFSTGQRNAELGSHMKHLNLKHSVLRMLQLRVT